MADIPEQQSIILEKNKEGLAKSNNEVKKKRIIDYTKGLSKEQVDERVRSGCTNVAVDTGSKTVKEIIFENLFTYFNLIFAVLAVFVCISGEFKELAFLPVVIANTLIGIIQELRAKKIVDNLTMLNVPKVSVVREGKEISLPPEELVLDDIVIFRAGNQICADAIVCAGEVQVNESLLTGESDEITKTKGKQLMSGSFIVSGECYARLNKVGADSYISKLTLQAKKMQDGEQSEMIRSLNKLVQIVGIAIIPIGIILFCTAFFGRHEGFQTSIISMVAAVIGMIPEGLYLLATVALVVSTMRLARKKVLLHDMKCIETLARVNVLCVDKTGTITENEMKVQDVVVTKNFKEETMGDINLILGDFADAMSSDNITMAAIKKKFREKKGRHVVSKTGFSSVTKYSSVTFEEGAFVLGAPEFVLKEKFDEYKEDINEYASKGIRVLVFGEYDEEIDGNELKHGVLPLAYVLLANPIRKSAKETFNYFAEQGVEIKVISGDNPVTVSEVAKQAGIKGAENYVDASTLDTDEKMREAILTKTVFGRVKPEQKRQFVNILKSAGNTVAMTGDGVNDILALKDADCSIAMASGSEAAAQSAKLVLLDSDFSCMPDVVYEGRRVVNNIQRSATLFIVKNIFSFIMSIFTLVIMVSYPLKPSQISLISTFTIGVPAFFLALEPNKNIIKGHFMTNVIIKALAAALTDALAVGAIVVFGQTFGLSSHDVSTAATILMAIVGFMILYKISVPVNKFRIAILLLCAVGLVFCSIYLSDLFGLTNMSTKCAMLCVVFAIASESLFRYLSLLVEKVSGFILKKTNN